MTVASSCVPFYDPVVTAYLQFEIKMITVFAIVSAVPLKGMPRDEMDSSASAVIAAEVSGANTPDGKTFALPPEKTQECDRHHLKVPVSTEFCCKVEHAENIPTEAQNNAGTLEFRIPDTHVLTDIYCTTGNLVNVYLKLLNFIHC
ncbi:hypothetical protein llap_13661 [Limosa lapponica baueri]|uniref:Uncharacterized protein n=1 Tax=Limosa lapponica baueri TaxID=1758121 RepID=A0A2I0TQG4_LIMLA|nr:hypothetical protein llap_13661 [Limosa lapponica baueri]